MPRVWTRPTHCQPVPPVANQLLVPGVPGYGNAIIPAAPVVPRGVAISFGGLNTAPIHGSSPDVTTYAFPGDSSGFLTSWTGSMLTNLLQDGWVLFNASYPENPQNPNPAVAVGNDMATDPTHGGRYLYTTLLWYDHLIDYCQKRWPGLALMTTGLSHGGWSALTMIAHRSDALSGCVVHIPATIWSNASQGWTTPGLYNSIDTSGMDCGPHLLDTCSLPVLISYGTSDSAVGWGDTTVSSGFTPTDVATFTGAGVIPIDTPGNITEQTLNGYSGPCVQVPTSTGTATLSFTGVSGGALVGVTTQRGSGVLHPGAIVTQSNANQIINNAHAVGRNNVVRNATNGNHWAGFSVAGQYFLPAGNPALSTLGTLPLNDGFVGGSGDMFVSGLTSIKTTDGAWHTINFTGTGTTVIGGNTVVTLTGCSYSGNNAARVAQYAPICASGDGTTHPMSWGYFVSQNI